ncbi:nucleoside diphosphate kinase homolog 5 isoform 3-T7 [Amazona ochrocephala]
MNIFFTSSTTAARFHFTGTWNGTDQPDVFADTENTDFVHKLGSGKYAQQRCGLSEAEHMKRKLQLSPEQCSNFYADQYGKMFFPNLTAYMSSGPIVAMALARYRAVSYWKELLGPSNSTSAKKTHPHSLRAIYGTDDLRNGLHGSRSISTAEREIRFMFPEVIMEPIPTGQRARDYLNLYVKPTLLAGLTALCKEKPADPMFSKER